MKITDSRPWLAVSIPFIARLAQCQVFVSYDSNLLTYSDNWDSPNAFGGCAPGYRSCSSPGASVQLLFSGTSIQASFLKDDAGVTALMYVDGVNVAGISTYDSSLVAFKACQSVVGAVQLTDGQHNITVVNNRSSGGTSIVALYFQGFSYQPSNVSTPSATTSSASPSSSLPSSTAQTPSALEPPTVPAETNTIPNPSSHRNSPVGAIVGGIIGGLALILFAIVGLVAVRRNRQTTSGSDPPHGMSSLTPEPFIFVPSSSHNAEIPHGLASSRESRGQSPELLTAQTTSSRGTPKTATSQPLQTVPANGGSALNGVEVESIQGLPPYRP